MNRVVTVDLRKLTGLAWQAGDKVVFRLREGSFTTEATYPKSRVEVAVSAGGVASATLWCNAEGLTESKYVCTLPSDEAFEFVLPAGEGAISVEVLRALNAVPYTPASAVAFLALLEAHASAEAAARVAAEAVYSVTLTADAVLDVGASLRALVLIDATGGDVTATLPPAAEMADRELTFKKVAGDHLGVIDADGVETIDGAPVFNLETVNQTVRLVAVAGAWYIA